jgi:starch-binding outer membrane protein, SusD/RagB family
MAEAANETGDGATAATMLEKIRARARGTTNALPRIQFVNQAQMRTAIKNERRFEFAMEGYRFYDLVRWGDAVSVLGPLGYTNRCRFYPIPQRAIDLSKINGVEILKQNPEW